VLFAGWSLVFPVTVHAATFNAAAKLSGNQWYIPMTGTGVAGSAVVATAATMLGRANPWIAAVTIGTPIMQYLLEKKAGGNIAIAGRNAPFPTPPGWTTDAQGPLPPLIESVGWTWDWQPCTTNCTTGIIYPTCDAAQNALVVAQGGTLSGQACPNGGSTCVSTDARRCYGTITGNKCPAGYTLGQGNCVLTNRDSAKWPSDGVPTYAPSADGTTIGSHPRELDPPPASPTPAEIMNPTKDYAPDVFGNPTSTTITPTSNGFSVEQRMQSTSNNQTTTTINNITINNAGQVTNIYTTTVPGGIELASPTATPVSSGSSPIQFPTDYNRETTQQAVKSKLDDIQAGTGAPDNPDFQAQLEQKKTDMNQEITEKLEAVPGQYSGDKGSWFSWVWTPPVGNCSPWISTIHGQSVSWDVCPYVEKVRDVIGFLLALFGGWSVYNEMFRRNES